MIGTFKLSKTLEIPTIRYLFRAMRLRFSHITCAINVRNPILVGVRLVKLGMTMTTSRRKSLYAEDVLL